VTSPSPLIKYLKVQRSTELAILAMLRHAERSIGPDLTMIEGMGDLSVSQRVKRAQLTYSKAAIHAAIDQHFAMVGGEIRGRRSQVAAIAGEVNADTAEIFKAAGLKPGEIKTLQRSMITSAQIGVEAAMARAQGKSYVPLSRQVYRTAALSKGQVSRMINDHLARGSAARELAADVRQFVKPEVHGGLRYASMRLARTELNNAFHAVSKDQAIKNPLVVGVLWHLSGSHPRPDRCNDFDQVEFLPQEVPAKPHPNCFCYTTPVTVPSDQFVNNYRAGIYDEYLDQLNVEAA
jgi:hypothetical protein